MQAVALAREKVPAKQLEHVLKPKEAANVPSCLIT